LRSKTSIDARLCRTVPVVVPVALAAPLLYAMCRACSDAKPAKKVVKIGRNVIAWRDR
jgi:hypothetical protein